MVRSKEFPLSAIIISLQRAVFYSSVLAFFAIMFNSFFHYSYVIAGVVIFSTVACGSLFQIFAGTLSDKFGRRRIAFVGQLAQGLGLILMGYSFITLQTYGSIAGFILINTGGNSVQASINGSIADSSSSVNSRIRNFAFIRTAINSGFGFGPLLTGFLLGVVNYGYLLEISGVISLVFLGFIPFIHSKNTEKQEAPEPTRSKVGVDPLIKLSITVFLLALVFGQLTSSLPVYEETVNNLTNSSVGALIGLNGLIIVLVQYPISRFVRDQFDWRWMGLGSAMYSLSIILLSVLTQFSSVIVVIALMTIGEAIFWSPAQALITSTSSSGKYGKSLGIWSFSVNIGRGVGAEYGLLFFSLFLTSHALMWFLIAVPGLLSSVLFSHLIKDIRKRVRSKPGSAF